MSRALAPAGGGPLVGRAIRFVGTDGVEHRGRVQRHRPGARVAYVTTADRRLQRVPLARVLEVLDGSA